MKKVILTVATVLTMGLIGHSQCDVNVKVDSYTQERRIETGFIDFRQGTFRLEKVKGKVHLYVSLNSYSYHIIDKGEIIYFKLEDGKIVKLLNTITSYGDYSTYTGNYNSFYFTITDEIILDAFQQSKIVGVKCYINEYDVQSSVGTQLQDNFKCITEIN